MKGSKILTITFVILIISSGISGISSGQQNFSTNSTITENSNNTTQNASENAQVVQQNGFDGLDNNLVCHNLRSGDGEPTRLGELSETILTIMVILGCVVAVTMGAFYTLMSAVNPGDESYPQKRNRSIIFGIGTIVVIYVVATVAGELSDAFNFTCILPYLD